MNASIGIEQGACRNSLHCSAPTIGAFSKRLLRQKIEPHGTFGRKLLFSFPFPVTVDSRSNLVGKHLVAQFGCGCAPSQYCYYRAMQDNETNNSRLDQKLRNKFYGNMLQFLRTASVESGRLRWDGDPDAVGRLLQLEEQHLHKWVDRYTVVAQLSRFTQEVVSKAVIADETKASLELSLSELIGNEALEKAASDTVEYLFGIPYDYEYRAHIRGVVGLDLSEPIVVSDILTLGCVDDLPEEGGLFRAVMGRALMGIDRDFTLAELKPGDTALTIRARGYSSQRIPDSAPAFALSIAKEFLAVAEASGIFETKHTREDRATTGLLAELPDNDVVNWVSNIPLQTLKRADKYCFKDSVFEYTGGLLAPRPGAKIKRTAEQARQYVVNCLEPFGRVFASDADKHAVALRTAAQWYFDAMAEDNETNAFIFTSLGFEALLGGSRSETESVGVKRLVGNRLAYLLVVCA